MVVKPLQRNWTCHWRNILWTHEINPEWEPIVASGSNLFRERGVRVGDRVYIVSLKAGQLLFGGRMTVERIATREEATIALQTDDLYEDAKWWVLGSAQDGTPLNLYRALAPEVTKTLRFKAADGKPAGLFFDSPTQLNVQATRGVRQLMPDSAELLEKILTVTDAWPHSQTMRTVSLQESHGP
jgi:hypothetical protein